MSATDEQVSNELVPALLCRRAASLLRVRGHAATPGPWSRAMKTRTKSAIIAATPDDAENYLLGREHVAICSVPHFDGGGFLRKRSGRDLDWIVLVGPHIAEPLADWLDAHADHAESIDGGDAVDEEPMAVARAVLEQGAS